MIEGFLHRSLYLQSIFCRCNVFFRYLESSLLYLVFQSIILVKMGGHDPLVLSPSLSGALLLYNFLLAGETCEFKEGGYGKNFTHAQKKYLIYLKSVLS